MSAFRKLGVLLCLLGFVGVCIAAFISTAGSPFAGMQGIQNDLKDRAFALVDADETPGLRLTVEGRDVTVELPDVVQPTFDRDAFERELRNVDGVRSVEIVGDPTVAVLADDAPPPVATEAPVAEPTEAPVPEPTAAPTAAPAPEPTAAPPTPVPPTPAPEPSLGDIVAGIDLSAVDFEPGNAELTGADQAVLDRVASQLQGQTGGPIQVQAHTDNIGDPDVNLLLSQDRAEAVVAYLTSRGVDGALLTSRGFGASQPIADNSTEQGRADNRRVVFVVEGN